MRDPPPDRSPKKIDDLERLIGLVDDRRCRPLGSRQNELTMPYRDGSPIDQVDDERPERLSFVDVCEAARWSFQGTFCLAKNKGDKPGF